MLSSPSVVFTADPLPSLPLQASISLTASHGTTTSSQEHPAPAASSCSLSALWSQRRTQSSGLLLEDEGLETGGSYKPSPAQSAVKLLDKLLDGVKASCWSGKGNGNGEGAYPTLCSTFNQRLDKLLDGGKASPRCRPGGVPKSLRPYFNQSKEERQIMGVWCHMAFQPSTKPFARRVLQGCALHLSSKQL